MHVSSYTNAVIIDTRCGFVNIVFLNILIDKAVIFIILHKFSVMLRKTCERTEFIVLFLQFIHQLYVDRNGTFYYDSIDMVYRFWVFVVPTTLDVCW